MILAFFLYFILKWPIFILQVLLLNPIVLENTLLHIFLFDLLSYFVEEFILLLARFRFILLYYIFNKVRLRLSIVVLFSLHRRLKSVWLLLLWHSVPYWFQLSPQWIMMERSIWHELAKAAFIWKLIDGLIRLIVDQERLLLYFQQAFHLVRWAKRLFQNLKLLAREQVLILAGGSIQEEVFEHFFDLVGGFHIANRVVHFKPPCAARALRFVNAICLEVAIARCTLYFV